MGRGPHLPLDPAPLTRPDDSAADASAQRDRSLEHDAETGLGPMQAPGALKADFVLDPGRLRTKLPVETAAQSPQSG